MELISLTIAAIVSAILGSVYPVPFTGIQPVYDFGARFQSALKAGYIVQNICELPQMVALPSYVDANFTRAATPSYPEAATRTVGEFSPFPADVAYTAIETFLSGSSPASLEPPSVTVSTGDAMERVSSVAGVAEFGPRLSQYPRPATVPFRAPDATISANRSLLEAIVYALYGIVLLVMLAVPFSILVTSWTVVRTFKARFAQVVEGANVQMEEAIDEALAGKSLLLERFDAANSKVAREINGLEKLVEAERMRVCAAAKEILEKELVSFRMSLGSRITGYTRELQQQFDQQAARVKGFLAGLETARLEIPDLEALQALFESFQDEVQRAQDRIGYFLCQIDKESASHERLEDSVKQVEVLLNHIMSRQDRAYAVAKNFADLMDRQAADEREAKEAEQRAARAALEAAKEKEEERKRKEAEEEEEKRRNAAAVAVEEEKREEQMAAGAQWGVFAGSAPLSLKEWEEGARICREGVERRERELQARQAKDPGASVPSGTGSSGEGRKRNRPGKKQRMRIAARAAAAAASATGTTDAS
ncbi:hypothetical protein VTN00DRAFT_2138 [Thermoascus crustaceus]|uniref:uncharacterized protein n=1 Tax=Thermoascus crustaceus TaxID=5088 RepID=UPI003742C38C